MPIGTIENGWHEGEKLANRNVPVGAKVYGSLVGGEGDIITTYFYDPAKRAFYSTKNWNGSGPCLLLPKEFGYHLRNLRTL